MALFYNRCRAECDKHRAKWCVAFDVDATTGLCHLGRQRLGHHQERKKQQHQAGESTRRRRQPSRRGLWDDVTSEWDDVSNDVSNDYDQWKLRNPTIPTNTSQYYEGTGPDPEPYGIE